MDIYKLQTVQQTLPDHITLIAVSKTYPISEIHKAAQHGCMVFAESRVQELKEKYDPLYTWHMIGHLQRNKVKEVIPLVDMIQSLDSLRLADEINKQCEKINKIMPVLLEVNISQEINKTGFHSEDIEEVIQYCAKLPFLKLQGLMCIGPQNENNITIEECFRQMQVLFNNLQARYGNQIMRHLSMGMSKDYQIAMQYGSTMIRLGTILFGDRKNKQEIQNSNL